MSTLCLSVSNVEKSRYLKLITLHQNFLQCLNIGKKILKKIFLLKKGVMCYEYSGLKDKYNETSLPPKENFFGKLKK